MRQRQSKETANPLPGANEQDGERLFMINSFLSTAIKPKAAYGVVKFAF